MSNEQIQDRDTLPPAPTIFDGEGKIVSFAGLNSIAQFAGDIQDRFWSQLTREGPNKDANLTEKGYVTDRFYVDVIAFTEAIDGYGGSARALPGLETAKLLKIQSDVAKACFERHPQYEPYRTLITEAATPQLPTVSECRRLSA